MSRRFCLRAVAWCSIAVFGQAVCWQAVCWQAAGWQALADEQAGTAGQPADSPQPTESAQPAAIFKQLDTNGDGQVTKGEAPAERKKLFKRLLRRADANGDGKLSEAEFIAGMNEDRPDLPAETPAGGGDQYARFVQADSGEVFKRLDVNGDGKVERSELPESLRARFEPFMESFDVDRDKALSREEFDKGHALLRAQAGVGQPGKPDAAQSARAGGVAAALLRSLDSDGDGNLSKEEIAASSAALLALDRDGDGALNRRELMAGAKATAAADGNAKKKKAQAKAAAPKLPDPQRLLARLRKMDANGDGKWSESELPPFLKKQFAKIDTNGDGSVDEDEVKQALEVMRQRAEKRAAKAAKP
ncbi:MAG TPA: hypothetical protein VFW87_04825 [Pirellulales bacterium]|nr:hypothetical protein [Pirellulales bacterium]